MRKPWLWAFLAGIVLITAIRPLLRREPEPPPVLGKLPEFALIDQNGGRFGSKELEGRPYIASFFFIRCPSFCPLLMKSIKRLDDAYRARGIEGIRLVSITVDPEYDDPEQLRAYAAEIGADPARWTLLTGDLDAIRRLAYDGFHVPVGVRQELPGGLFDIAHSGKLILVDGKGAIRGYYDTDESGLDEAYNRAQHVLKEAGGRL
jgi:protein SCO1/2